MRIIEPLDEEHCKLLMDGLESGQTKEQTKRLKVAIESKDKIKVLRD